jgi:hypothetical protein
MLGDLISPLTKGLLLVAFLAIATAFTTTYLYLGTRDKLVALETQHTQLKQELKECSEGKSKVVEGAKQDDTINVEKEDNISVLKDEKDLLLKKLSDLQNTRKCTPKQPTPSSENVNEIINVNDSWDADVQQLLDNTYRSNKRDSNPTP